MLGRLREERGVAALTVMLVTAILAVAGAVVIYSTTAELEVENRERRAEDAFAAAEAGLDLAAAHLFGQPTWAEGQTEECLDNPLVPPDAGLACEVRITSSSDGLLVYPPGVEPYVDYTAVSYAKEGRTVTRTLAATFHVETVDVPLGMFVNGNVDLNGHPAMHCISLLVTGTVTERKKADFDCNDNNVADDPDLGWSFHEDLINSDPAPDMCLDPGTGQQVGCASVYASFQIFSKKDNKNTDEIHFASNDPALSDFPHDRDVHQTEVDGSGQALPVVSIPSDAVLSAMEPLKSLAQAQGLYLNYKDGKKQTKTIEIKDIGGSSREFEKNVVVYIDADADDEIKWKVELIPGSTSSDIKYTNDAGQRVGSLSGVLVVRGGKLTLESNTEWSGAIFVPENTIKQTGGATVTGTIYTLGFSKFGGSSVIQLTDDWFEALPAGFVDVTRTAFLECEPFQASEVCPAT